MLSCVYFILKNNQNQVNSIVLAKYYGWANPGGWDGCGIRHKCGRRKMHTGFWWIYLKERNHQKFSGKATPLCSIILLTTKNPRERWTLNWIFKEVGWESMDRTHLAEDMDKQLAVVNTAMNFRVPLNEVDFFQLLRNYYLLKKDSAPCNYYYYYYLLLLYCCCCCSSK